MKLHFDFIAVFICIVCLLIFIVLYYFFKNSKKPFIYVSNLSSYKIESPSIKQRVSKFPHITLWLALIFFWIAYVDPHSFIPKNSDSLENPLLDRIPTEGIAIYLTLDVSQSMLEELSSTSSNGEVKSVSKIDILKNVTKQFVQGDPTENLKGRYHDLIGIVTFSRAAQILSPLTLDHQNIVNLLDQLTVNRDEDQKGTALGYAIFKSANLIEATRHFGEKSVQDGEPAYKIKNSVILLITDGFQEINPDDYGNPLRSIELDEAVNYVKDLGIRLYIVDIDPSINSSKYADYREFFRLLTEMTGGKFFYLSGTKSLIEIYQEIDRLEKGTIPDYYLSNMENMPHLYKRISFYPYLIAAGIACLFIYVILETMILRIVP